MRREKNSMKKTVSILTALLLVVSPVAQRAYAQEAPTQVQQNVEESKASKVWGTVKECADKTVNAVAENKGIIIGSALALAALGEVIFATVNGVTFSDTIHTIWTDDSITMAQKAKLIAKVLFLRKKIDAAELTALKNQNIIDASSAIINESDSIIDSADKMLQGIAAKQGSLNTQRADQEEIKNDAMCSKKGACDVYKKTLADMNITLESNSTCVLDDAYKNLNCTAYNQKMCDCGKKTEKSHGDCGGVCPEWNEKICECDTNDKNKNFKCVQICDAKRCNCSTNEQLSDKKCQKVCPALNQDICNCNTENQLTLEGCDSICAGKFDNNGTSSQSTV